VQIPSGKNRATFLKAMTSYMGERSGRPWSLIRRNKTGFVIRHASPRAADASYRVSRSTENAREARIRVSGKSARLAVGYVITLLVSDRFSDLVESVRIDLQ
jgi:hypothetical protein